MALVLKSLGHGGVMMPRSSYNEKTLEDTVFILPRAQASTETNTVSTTREEQDIMA